MTAAAALALASALGLFAATGPAAATSPRAADNKVILTARQDPGTLDYTKNNLTAVRLWIPANVVEPLVYFNKDGNVERLAHYTLQDGKVFDMIARVTPTGGAETTFLGQLLRGGANPGNIMRNLMSNN